MKGWFTLCAAKSARVAFWDATLFGCHKKLGDSPRNLRFLLLPDKQFFTPSKKRGEACKKCVFLVLLQIALLLNKRCFQVYLFFGSLLFLRKSRQPQPRTSSRAPAAELRSNSDSPHKSPHPNFDRPRIECKELLGFWISKFFGVTNFFYIKLSKILGVTVNGGGWKYKKIGMMLISKDS